MTDTARPAARSGRRAQSASNCRAMIMRWIWLVERFMTKMQIDGATRLYAIIGDPVSAVRSPEVFNAMFKRRGGGHGDLLRFGFEP